MGSRNHEVERRPPPGAAGKSSAINGCMFVSGTYFVPGRNMRKVVTMAEKTFWQTIETTGEQLLATIKQLIEAGNVRRIRVRQKDRVVAEFPLTVGVLGTVIAPIAAAIGALTAVLTECTIDVERVETTKETKDENATVA